MCIQDCNLQALPHLANRPLDNFRVFEKASLLATASAELLCWRFMCAVLGHHKDSACKKACRQVRVPEGSVDRVVVLVGAGVAAGVTVVGLVVAAGVEATVAAGVETGRAVVAAGVSVDAAATVAAGVCVGAVVAAGVCVGADVAAAVCAAA